MMNIRSRFLINFSRKIVQFRSYKVEINEAKIHKKMVKFRTVTGKQVEVNAVYEDSHSSGSSVGTVVAFHGSPGSHNDFKYIRRSIVDSGIRFIGLNYPGFKQTEGYTDQQHVNEERQSYTNAFLRDEAITGKVIFMAHSRGCENALMTATQFPATGLVMINPTGLRPNKMIRPIKKLQRVEKVYDWLPKYVADVMMYKIYQVIGMKVQDGEEAINALRSVTRCSFEATLPYIHKLQEQDTKTFMIFAGNDDIVEEEIVFEALKEYKNLKHFDFESEILPEDYAKILNSFDSGKGASVFVKSDTHYQNKKRADVVAAVVKKIFGLDHLTKSNCEKKV